MQKRTRDSKKNNKLKTKRVHPNKRVFINVKDIQVITGKKEKACYQIILKIKQHYKKERHQAITFKEFYRYFGIEQEE